MANFTWIDNASTYGWDDGAGWDQSGPIPGNGDSVTIPSSSSPPITGPSAPVSLVSLNVSEQATMPDLSVVTIDNGNVVLSGSCVFNGTYSGTCSGSFDGSTSNSGGGTLATGTFNGASTNIGGVTNGLFNANSINAGGVTNLFLNSPSVNLSASTATTIIATGTVVGSQLRLVGYTNFLFGAYEVLALSGIPPATGGGGGPLGGPGIAF